MPVVEGVTGLYTWRDGSTSTLAPPSDSLDRILQQPTTWAMDPGQTFGFEKIYKTQPFVGAAVRFLAGQFARMPLKSFVKLDSSGAARERDVDSALALALVDPNDRRSAHEFKRDIAMDLWINGNHLEKIILTGEGLKFERILWSQAWPIWNDAYDEIVGWKIIKPGEPIQVLTQLDVVHFAFGNPSGPLGISPMQQLDWSIQIDRASVAHQLATLKNGAKTGVLLSIDPDRAKDAELRDSIRQEFVLRHSGPGNSGRPFVGGGVEVKQLPQMSMVDAELIKGRIMSREEVSAVFQLPTMFLGDLGKATQNNYSEAYRQLFKTTLAEPFDLVPSQLRSQVILQHEVAPTGSYVEFDVNGVLFGDPVERATMYAALEKAMAITVNEVRDLENRPRFDNRVFDEPLVAVNNLAPASAAFVENSGDLVDPQTDPATSLPQ